MDKYRIIGLDLSKSLKDSRRKQAGDLPGVGDPVLSSVFPLCWEDKDRQGIKGPHSGEDRLHVRVCMHAVAIAR